MPEKVHKPVDSFWTVSFTNALLLCWLGIGCLICGTFTGFTVMDTLLKGSNNLQIFYINVNNTWLYNTLALCKKKKDWSEWTSTTVANLDVAINRPKNNNIDTECQCDLLFIHLSRVLRVAQFSFIQIL